MNKTTIILPISRDKYIDRIFSSLELLECDRSLTNLLVIVDSRDNQNLYLKARNLTNEIKFKEKLCFAFSDDGSGDIDTIDGRRIRISNIHNQFRVILKTSNLKNSDFIFGIEDDTLFPEDSLLKFQNFYSLNPHAGFIEGLELGRHSCTYAGAWKVDDVYTTSSFTSISEEDVQKGVSSIDSGGFYCFMTRLETYTNHLFKPFENNDLGPDADFGISLRRNGFENFIDSSVNCIHLSGEDSIFYPKYKIQQVEVYKDSRRWKQKIVA